MAGGFGRARVRLAIAACVVLAAALSTAGPESPAAFAASTPTTTDAELQAAATELLGSLTATENNDFAGAFIDRQGEPVLVAQFARDTEKHRSALERRFKISNRLSVRAAPHTVSVLNEAIARIPGALTADGIEWSHVARDDESNTVRVAVVGDVERARRALASRFGSGDLVVIESVPAASSVTNGESLNQFTAPPIVAGLQISRPAPTPGDFVQCSSSFVARGASNGQRYLLTAGHCVAPTDRDLQFSVGCCPGTHLIGGAEAFAFFNNGSADAARLRPLDGGIGYRPDVYCEDTMPTCPGGSVQSNNFYVSRVGTLGDGDDIQGASVCDVGWNDENHGNFCGHIQSTNATVNYGAGGGFPAVSLINQRIASPVSEPGMSGGAVYARADINQEPIKYTTPLNRFCCDTKYPVHALGVISGKTGSGDLIYSHISHVGFAMNVNVETG